MNRPILNYTTKIDSYKTITEIQKTLSAHGAKKMIIDNDDSGLPTSLTFCIDWHGAPLYKHIQTDSRLLLSNGG